MKPRRMPDKVMKRDGAVVPFTPDKIQYAIYRAALEVLQDSNQSGRIARRLVDIVVQRLAEKYRDKPLHVEAIQDMVETVLMNQGYGRIAKSYILYRERRSEIRLAKSVLGMKDDLKLPLNTMEVLKRRYLQKDDQRKIIETPSMLFRRVAHHIAQGERNFKSSVSPGQAEEKFYQMMRNLEFMPNSPTLMNAGASLGQLSACFVIPVEDSIDGIFGALTSMAKIHQTGGGTGFNFSRLRPKKDLVASTMGEASGPVSFMGIFDRATEVIVQGGRRRGANMGILRVDHPDVMEFIEAKVEKNRFSNFNLSVGVTDLFMKAVLANRDFDLINPRTREKVKRVKARMVFDLIVNAAWLTGDPGLIFLDEINRKNPTPRVGTIEATNPCGELPLLPYESCNLASLNLSRMVKRGTVDWEKLKEYVHWGVRFLDDVIEVNKFPLPQIEEITFANRKIGLGVMGFADLLIRLGIPYGSREAVRFAERLMRFIHRESIRTSCALAEERGVFPNYPRSVYAPRNLRMRQCHGQHHRSHRDDQHHRRMLQRHRASIRGQLHSQCSLRNPSLRGQPFLRGNRPFPGILRQGTLRPDCPFGLPAEDQGDSHRYQEDFCNRLRRRSQPAPGDPGGLSEIHRQLRLQNHQPAPGINGRGYPENLPVGLPAEMQGDHGLPVRKQGSAGFVLRLRRKRRTGGTSRSSHR